MLKYELNRLMEGYGFVYTNKGEIKSIRMKDGLFIDDSLNYLSCDDAFYIIYSEIDRRQENERKRIVKMYETISINHKTHQVDELKLIEILGNMSSQKIPASRRKKLILTCYQLDSPALELLWMSEDGSYMRSFLINPHRHHYKDGWEDVEISSCEEVLDIISEWLTNGTINKTRHDWEEENYVKEEED